MCLNRAFLLMFTESPKGRFSGNCKTFRRSHPDSIKLRQEGIGTLRVAGILTGFVTALPSLVKMGYHLRTDYNKPIENRKKRRGNHSLRRRVKIWLIEKQLSLLKRIVVGPKEKAVALMKPSGQIYL